MKKMCIFIWSYPYSISFILIKITIYPAHLVMTYLLDGGTPKPNMPKLPDFPRSLPESPMLPSSLRFGQESLLDRPPPMLDPLLLHKKLLSQKMGPAVLGGPSSALGGPPSQSLYEMAALTHEMDTQAVTTKVKEILLANNVGQKVRLHFSFIIDLECELLEVVDKDMQTNDAVEFL